MNTMTSRVRTTPVAFLLLLSLLGSSFFKNTASAFIVCRPPPSSLLANSRTVAPQAQTKHAYTISRQGGVENGSQLFAQRTFSTRPSPSNVRQRRSQQQQQQQSPPPPPSPQQTRRRGELLSRNGPYFQLNRLSGQIEFGATARLSTQLVDDAANTEAAPESTATSNNNDNDDEDNNNNNNMIATWLKDERGLAMSIWDEKLTTDLGNHVYRLQIMTLQFVTLQLSPSVDVRMRTIMVDDNDDAADAQTKNQQQQQQQQQPVFTLDSVAFDPNIEILPGMKISAESLGIIIEVAGELRQKANNNVNGDGRGNGDNANGDNANGDNGDNGGVVQGRIAFSTSGSLPPPMRVLPDAVLKAASDTINETVANFAIESFQRGARAQYRSFLKKQEQEHKEQQQRQKQQQKQQQEAEKQQQQEQ